MMIQLYLCLIGSVVIGNLDPLIVWLHNHLFSFTSLYIGSSRLAHSAEQFCFKFQIQLDLAACKKKKYLDLLMYIYSGTHSEGAALFYGDQRSTRHTCIFHVSNHLTPVNIPLTNASHINIIKFKVEVLAGIFISWSWEEEVDIIEQ